MKKITNDITNDVYSNTPAPQSQPQPKRKNAKGNQYHKADPMLRVDNRLDAQSLVDENDRLHALQVEFKRKKFLGLF